MIRRLILLCATVIAVNAADDRLSIAWTNNLLTLSSAHLPGGKMEIWYLEAFCRPGAHNQSWDKTKIPHKTTLVEASPNRLKFQTDVTNGVHVEHTVVAGSDELDFRYEFTNTSSQTADIQWFEPACIRVAEFTGRNQTNFIERSFIFSKDGITPLSKTDRTEEALYRGGQVFIPRFIKDADANPRPLSGVRPENGLIGCYSADNQWLLATASDQTHELFEGVYVCLHSDPSIGELKPHETRSVHAKLYLMKNDVPALLKRYKKDFPHARNQRLPF